MATYRPVSQNQAWRSQLSTCLTIQERYCLLYLLTCPFSNSIGAFEIVPTIAAAEMGLSSPELDALLGELMFKNIIFLCGNLIIVRPWFLHNKWESTFQGNVKKLAHKEINFLSKIAYENFLNACIQACVPINVVTELRVCSSTVGPLKELEDNNGTEHLLNTTLPDTTDDVGSSCSDQIYLIAALENHRIFIENRLKNFKITERQLIADETSGTFEAAAKGNRPPIVEFESWFKAIVKAFEKGDLSINFAHNISSQRLEFLKKVEADKIDEMNKRNADINLAKLIVEAEIFLQNLDSSQLEEFAAYATAIYSNNLRTQLRTSILDRKFPPSKKCHHHIAKCTKTWRQKEDE